MTELADLARDLLRGTERCDLPPLTREELLATGLELPAADDVAWADALTRRERQLLAGAGLRSLVARGLITSDVQPADDLRIVCGTLEAPAWLVLLSESATGRQLLYRGVPGSDTCLVAGAAAGVHRHSLVRLPAAIREARRWLLGGEPGAVRLAARVGVGESGEIRVRRTPEGAELLVYEDRATTATPELLDAWLRGGDVDGA